MLRMILLSYVHFKDDTQTIVIKHSIYIPTTVTYGFNMPSLVSVQ